MHARREPAVGSSVDAMLYRIETNLPHCRHRFGNDRTFDRQVRDPLLPLLRRRVLRKATGPARSPRDPLFTGPLFDASGRIAVPVACSAGDEGSSVLVDTLEEFREALAKVAPGFGQLFRGRPLPAGVVAVGGAVAAALQRPPFRKILDGADVDLLIFGADHATRMRAMRRVLDLLLSVQPRCRIKVRGRVVNLEAPDGGGTVQVVYTAWRDVRGVLLDADMSYLQVAYDGSQVHATWPFLWSMTTRAAFVSGVLGSKPKERLTKAKRKGFAVLKRSDVLSARL